MKALNERATAITEYLQESAGLDSLSDRYKAGYLAAVRDVVHTSVEEISE